MKQAIDKYTADMYGDAGAPMKAEKRIFRAYVETTNGTRIVWTHLTLTQAKAMEAMCTNKFNILQSNTELATFGWEEM